MAPLENLRNWLIFLTILSVSSSSLCQTNTPIWVTQHGGTGSDWGHAIATDPSGNVFSVGNFQNTADFDPGPGVSNITSNGGYDLFFQKLDPNGNLLWVKTIGGPLIDEVKTVASDSQGNLIAVYRTSGTADMDPGPAVLNLTSSVGTLDMYVIKLNPNGDLVWVKQFEGSSSIEGLGVATNSNDDILIAGYHFGTADFDSGTGTNNISAMGSSDAFILKLNQNGDFVWIKHIGGTFEDQANALAIDTSDAIICTGYFGGTADMNPNVGVDNLTSNGDDDAFVLKLDANGNYLWAHSIGGSDRDEGRAIDADNAGNIYYAGSFRSTADLAPGAGVNNVSSAGSNDIFIQKYDPNGIFLWSKNMGSIGNDYPNSLAVDSQGSVYTTGGFSHTVDFDPGPAVSSYTMFGSHDIFIQKLDLNGNFEALMQLGGPNADYGAGITVDAFGDLLTTGYFREDADFDPGPAFDTLTSFGAYDCYVLKLDGCSPYAGVNTISACESYTWIDGVTYTTSNNTATYQLSSPSGCDSVAILDLTINSPSFATDTHIACNSFTWIDGITYSTSNQTATYMISNAAGCDSVITLDLDILDPSESTDTQTACDSFSWIDGNTYTSSNNSSSMVLTSAAGCDSIVMLDLTINNSSTSTDPHNSCNSFTWIDGNTYTSSNNSATFTLQNAVGCDSVVTLDLVINTPTTSTDTHMACDSFTWINGNTYNTSNYTDQFTLTNSLGCDSIVTLDLTLNSSTFGTDTHIACDSFMWINGNTYSASNYTDQFTLTNSLGCDSIVTLDLTLNSSTFGTDTQVACDSLTWIDGVTYTTDTTSSFSIMNSNECDSLVSLDLTIKNSTSATQSFVACHSFTWIDGITYYSSNNSANYTTSNAVGCDSTILLDLVIEPNTIDNTLSLSGDTITANQVGLTYQWIDCEGGNTPIPGATNHQFIAPSNGVYAVIISDGICTDTSSCVYVSEVGTDEIGSSPSVFVYPNPTSKNVCVITSSSNAKAAIHSLDGKVIRPQTKLIQSEEMIFQLENVAKGIYLIIVEDKVDVKTVRLVVD